MLMEIRRIEAGDEAGITKLVLEVYKEASFATTFEKEPNPEDINSIVKEKLWMVASGDAADYVAVESGELIGECEAIKDGSTGKVGILVAKGHRKKGIGSTLLRKCEEDARKIGITKLVAEIASINSAAISFFVGFGFAIKGEGYPKAGAINVVRAEKEIAKG